MSEYVNTVMERIFEAIFAHFIKRLKNVAVNWPFKYFAQ
jgi:hypothetical protein